MEFACSVCHYTSSQKQHIIKHTNRKKSCGIGNKEIVEIPIEIECEFCDKKFSSKKYLQEHLKHACKYKDIAKDEEIKRLKKELNNSKQITINNNNNIIIIVNNYENTDLSKLTDKIFNKLIKNTDEPYQIIPKLIQEIHFNPDIPENHNIRLSNRNKNNRHLEVYRDGHWEIENKTTEIDNLINDKETNLSDWVAEKKEKYPEANEIFSEYLETKYDDDTVKLVKEEVEKILYNKKHMTKNV